MSDSASGTKSESDDESTVASYDSYTSCNGLLRHSCNSSLVSFRCEDLSFNYNENDHKHELISVLNRYSDTYPDLENLYIEHARHPELFCSILSHFVRKHSHLMYSFVFDNCDVSAFFNDFGDLISYSSNNEFSSDRAITIDDNDEFSPDRAITIDDSKIENNNVIRTTIENCSFFTSWNFILIDNDDIIFTLNALANNVYIQSLRVVLYPIGQQQEEMLIDSVIKVVKCTKTLSNLKLNFANKILVSERAVTGLVEALINSKVITHLFFESISFANVGLLEKFMCLFKNKSNIQTLQLNPEMFNINGNFNELIFLNFCKNSIPCMGNLCFFCFGRFIEMLNSRSLQKIFCKSIGQCSRTLDDVSPRVEGIEKFLKRNCKITTCIEEKAQFVKSAWPKIFSITNPTGPDAIFHFLCNLSHSIGPDESLMVSSSIETNNTTSTATKQCKRKSS